MRDFQFYVTDDRYEVRSLMLVQTQDADRARFLARKMLSEKHHHAVEVWSGEEKLFSVARCEPSQV